jgi:2-polyprenyl-6-methoxyphenol hydroxylase-like FAD-dependent oxidoreductase
MFIESRNVEQNAVVKTTVCIVGAGVAGITLALELDNQGVDTVLLESGGYKPDDATRDLYRGQNVGFLIRMPMAAAAVSWAAAAIAGVAGAVRSIRGTSKNAIG